MTDRPRDERIHELATAYALNEASEAELQELYDLLRADGDAGRAAANVAWQALQVHGDLRQGLSTQFQDTLLHRLQHVRSNRFTAALRSKLGLRLPGLSEVGDPQGRRALPLVPLGIGLLLLLGIVLLAVPLVTRREPVAMVLAVGGSPTQAGQALVPKAQLDRRQVVVPPGSEVTIVWAAGGRVRVAGPANLVPQGQGLSLVSGRAWIVTAAEFTIGLPDGTVVIARGSRVAIAVADGRSVVGVSTGTALRNGVALPAGRCADPEGTWPWSAAGVPALPWSLPLAGARDWRLDLHLSGSGGADDQVALSATNGTRIEIAANSVRLRHAGADLPFPFTAAPRAERHIAIQQVGLVLLLWQDEQLLTTWPVVLRSPTLSATGAVVVGGELRTGPEDGPWP